MQESINWIITCTLVFIGTALTVAGVYHVDPARGISGLLIVGWAFISHYFYGRNS